MESPNQYLSPEASFARIAPTSFEIQGSKVCSTIRPLPLRHYFGWSSYSAVQAPSGLAQLQQPPTKLRSGQPAWPWGPPHLLLRRRALLLLLLLLLRLLAPPTKRGWLAKGCWHRHCYRRWGCHSQVRLVDPRRWGRRQELVAGRGQPGQQRWKTSERKRGLMKTQHSASPA